MRAVERAYSVLREGIVQGRYDAGAHLTEQALARTVGVSRTPIREALRRLHTEGLVQFEPNRGAVVTLVEPEDAEEIFELRALLEPLGAQRAAERATPAVIAELRSLAEQQVLESRRAGRHVIRIGELNDCFHRLIQQVAGSARLAKALTGLVEGPLILRTFRQYSVTELQRSAHQHLELVQAFETRDPSWAYSIMQAHVLAGRAAYLRSHRRI
jgi:DNA-binding GntR family transcriptional regulator